MNIQNVQNLQGLIPAITFIINIARRMRLVEILKFIFCLLVLAMSHFLYKWATLMERSDCRVIFFLLCIGAALVLVLGTVVAVLEGREDEHEGRPR
jgi:MFS superfamily sulfate permease-like transporter